MPNFEQTLSNLPTTDKDGNPITDDNPLSLEDILVRIIDSTDPVLGLVPGELLEDHLDSPYNWAFLGLFLRDIFIDERITQALAELLEAIEDRFNSIQFPTHASEPPATETLAGILEIANQTEGRSGTNHNRAMTSLRVLDFLRNGIGAGASTTEKGTVERATQAEATGLSDTTRYITAALVKAILQHANAEATTTKRGTVELATNSETLSGSNTAKGVTPAGLKHFADNYNFP